MPQCTQCGSENLLEGDYPADPSVPRDRFTQLVHGHRCRDCGNVDYDAEMVRQLFGPAGIAAARG